MRGVLALLLAVVAIFKYREARGHSLMVLDVWAHSQIPAHMQHIHALVMKLFSCLARARVLQQPSRGSQSSPLYFVSESGRLSADS